jgi:hypothetical protein
MTTKKRTKKTDRLFDIFCGEAVAVMVNRDSESTTQTEIKIETLKAPIVLAGYLVDTDDEFLYLGLDPDAINQAVRRDTVVHIEIMENPLDEIMNGMDFGKEGGLN